MTDDDVLSQINYLEEELRTDDEQLSFGTPADIGKFIRAAIQLEYAQRLDRGFSDERSLRLASLEAHILKLADEIASRHELPVVQYVASSRTAQSASSRVPHTAKIPNAIIAFYALGLACSLVFAILLALSSNGISLIHPFLSLIGFVGGLGWLTTAWTDLLIWKHEIMPVCEADPDRKEEKVAAQE